MAAEGSSRPHRRRFERAAALGILMIALVTAPAAGLAQAQAPPAAGATADRFRAADKNGDGKIDREEFQRLVVESFYFRDKERKGYLTKEDLREASPEAFKAANRKGDGRLTLQEYVNALFIDFDKADTDHDGLISMEEFEAYRRSR